MADLVVVKGAHRGAFAKVLRGSVVIGRADDADLSLGDDAKASHRHARVTALGNERYLLEDLGSTNGTFVNNERVEQTPLRSGDLVKIGRSLIVFRAGASSVRLEDLATNDGGSTGSIARRSDGSAEAAASSSAVDLPPGASRTTHDAEVRQALGELILASGEVALAQGLDRTLAVVLRAVGGGRALLFLRHPMTGGLGCAASRCEPGAAPNAPVDSSLLARAVRGEIAASERAAAAPIRIQGLPAGALYVDACQAKPVALDVLAAACVLAGLQVGLDRSRRLASAASEIVGLGQAQVDRRPLDLSAHLAAAEQMYVNAAQQRGLTLEVAAPPGVVVLVDPGLLSRGLDRLVEHVLSDARGWIGMSLVPSEGRARLLVRATLSQVPEPPGAILAPQGVAADLRRCWELFGDGMLAVARVALQRAGARLSAQPDGPTLVFALDMEPSPS